MSTAESTDATATHQRYVRFAYDTYSSLATYDVNGKLVVRGVTLLDYTPGGPDFRPDLFFGPGNPENPVCNDAGSQATGTCSTPLPIVSGRNGGPSTTWQVDIGGNDEIHGESGDDTVYGAVANDVIYGDAQDDDLIGGWGNDWISGGTGMDGMLGDDGRIFTSRNTGCTTANCWVSNPPNPSAVYSEPLSGETALLIGDPDTKKTQGYVLNEAIYTPGHVQDAIINVGGALKKEVDLTPYNLGLDTAV